MSSSPIHNADAIVVGAGLSGAWAAKELASRGMQVALIDAGSILPKSAFSIDRFRTDLFNPRYHLFRLKLLLKGQADRALSKFILRETYRLFLDRRKDNYITSWFRVRAVGGAGTSGGA